MRKTIVAVGAHTGDAQLTAGLLLAKHAMAGHKVVTIDLTAGERGCPAGRTPEDFRSENVAAAQAFAQGLGGESCVLDAPDGELEHTQAAALELATLLRRLKADAVLCHWKHSMHKDHIAAYKITTDAVFFAALGTFPHELPPAPIRRVLFAENWEDAEHFSPYLYFDVTEAFPLWQSNIRKLWLAENSRSFQYLRYYDALSVTRGCLIGKERAVACAVEDYAKRQVLEAL